MTNHRSTMASTPFTTRKTPPAISPLATTLTVPLSIEPTLLLRPADSQPSESEVVDGVTAADRHRYDYQRARERPEGCRRSIADRDTTRRSDHRGQPPICAVMGGCRQWSRK